MADAHVINIVAIDCKPEDEKKFVHWYDEVHIPMLLGVKGLLGVKRYELASPRGTYAQHLAIYEFENKAAFDAYEKSTELAAARKEVNETWKESKFDPKWRVQYEFLRSWGE